MRIAVRPQGSSAARERLNRNASRQRRTQGEASASNLEQHAMARVYDVETDAFTETQCPKPTGFVCPAADIHHGGSATSCTGRQRAGARSGGCGRIGL